MKSFGSWGAGKTSRKRKRAVLKTRIRWDLLGLQDPGRVAPTPSMEDIRRQIISMSSQGLGARSRSEGDSASGRSTAHNPVVNRKRRHGPMR